MTGNPAVLIIEDDLATVHLLTAVIRRSHFDASHCCDGETALQALASRDFDVVLLDLLLPKLDGREILRRVMLATPHLLQRMIVVTALSPDDYRDCDAIGSVWCVFRKPFELAMLEEQMLECYAESHRQAVRLAAAQ